MPMGTCSTGTPTTRIRMWGGGRSRKSSHGSPPTPRNRGASMMKHGLLLLLLLAFDREFLSIGQLVPNTKLRVTSFEFKTRHNTKTNEEEDISELTLTDTKTNQRFVLKHSTPARE